MLFTTERCRTGRHRSVLLATLPNYAPGLNPPTRSTSRSAANPERGPTPCGGGAFTVRNFDSADLVADAVGYDTPHMYVLVDASGILVESSGVGSVTGAAGHAVGRFDIEFDRNVSTCSATASEINWSTHNDVSTDLGNGSPLRSPFAITQADG